MPRGLYHVYTCGTGPSAIFHDQEDHENFNWTLGTTLDRYAWLVLMWVHLSTHVHLLVETPEPNLDLGMQRLKSCYARGYNRKYGRRGALFDGRYGCRVIQTELQLFRTVAYIARNPVEAGLCVLPEQWRWSSYVHTLRESRPWPANGSYELLRRCGGVDGLRAVVAREYELDAA